MNDDSYVIGKNYNILREVRNEKRNTSLRMYCYTSGGNLENKIA